MRFDHEKYFLDKMEQKDRQIEVYQKCLKAYMEWFTLNKKHIKKFPVTRIPKMPWDNE